MNVMSTIEKPGNATADAKLPSKTKQPKHENITIQHLQIPSHCLSTVHLDIFKLLVNCLPTSPPLPTPTMATHLTALINQAKASDINAFADFGTLDPSKRDTIDSIVRKEKCLVDCMSILSNPDIVLQYILVVGDKFQLLTHPVPRSASDGTSIIMGSLSNIIGHPIPVSMRHTHFTQCFTLLVTRDAANRYSLPTLAEQPDTI
jgi:hypothetical protein